MLDLVPYLVVCLNIKPGANFILYNFKDQIIFFGRAFSNIALKKFQKLFFTGLIKSNFTFREKDLSTGLEFVL